MNQLSNPPSDERLFIDPAALQFESQVREKARTRYGRDATWVVSEHTGGVAGPYWRKQLAVLDEFGHVVAVAFVNRKGAVRWRFQSGPFTLPDEEIVGATTQ